jgi:hypothetical protein
MTTVPRSITDMEQQPPSDERLETDHEDGDVAHRTDPHVVQPASGLEMPTEDPLAGATGGKAS